MTQIVFRAKGGMYDRNKPGWAPETQTYEIAATGPNLSQSGVWAVESSGRLHRIRHVGSGLLLPMYVMSENRLSRERIALPYVVYERGSYTLPNVTAARKLMKLVDSIGILGPDHNAAHLKRFYAALRAAALAN